MKEFMSRSIPFAALTDKNVKLPGKEEALRFYLTATAMVLKQFHSQMDYAFEATQICTYMIIDHASGLSTDKATDLFNKDKERDLSEMRFKYDSERQKCTGAGNR